MLNLVSVIAAAVFTFSAVPTLPPSAATAPTLEPVLEEAAAPADGNVDLAYFCEYVILWDAWGNAYYEYICY